MHTHFYLQHARPVFIREIRAEDGRTELNWISHQAGAARAREHVLDVLEGEVTEQNLCIREDHAEVGKSTPPGPDASRVFRPTGRQGLTWGPTW